MIRIRKPRSAPPVLRTKGVAKTEEHRAALETDPAARIRFDGTIFGHPSVLRALQQAHRRSKCAFCERRVECAVEHYRPKSEVKQGDGHPVERPGYWWLAYDWDDLLLACDPCNSRHKRNQFPLRRPERRARRPDDRLGDEEPLLLNPAVTDPAEHITFRGEFAVAADGSDIGATTIAVLRLNDSSRRGELVKSRFDRLVEIRRCRAALESLVAVRERLRRVGGPVPGEIAEQIAAFRRALRRCRSPDAEFSAMARADLTRR